MYIENVKPKQSDCITTIIMNKLKTRKSAKKRFRKTGTGQFVRRRACKGHLLEKKSSKRKRSLSQRLLVFKGDALAIKSMVLYN
jgi:large subunit ribosomal protein L35